MTNKIHTLALCAALLACLAASCEKPVIDEEKTPTEKPKANEATITFNSTNVAQAEYDNETDTQQSRAVTPIREVCSRINVAIFDSGDATKVKTINQEKSDASFGKITTNLAKGSYTIVIIAHNGSGNATVSTPEKVTFKDNKVSDTFYYYGDIDVDDNETYDITLKRAVAMVRLVVKDNTPKNIHSMKFYYTGGSSTLNPQTGYGCVNSKQTEIRTVPESAYTGESAYDIYTFPHESQKKLNIEISALESATATNATYARTISDVSVKRNCITRYTGYFYGEDPSTGRGIELTTTDEWQYEDHEY